jgi:CheY-like chemotaxis protein
MALKASQNAAQLTHRLLAFSRQQALDPAIIDASQLVESLDGLLSRTIGETVELKTLRTGESWPIFADTNQLENVLVNLALNARDAMPGGGLLTIETCAVSIDGSSTASDIPAGEYVVIAVTDTGEGMSSDVVERAFEPFFTTKEVGKGTGLGLSMVYGFMKQSGGHVRIYSEPGHGTSVKLYFPRAESAARDRIAPRAPAGPVPRAREGETILIVEDNDGVRGYSASALRDLGYTVFEAANAGEAFAFLTGQPELRADLLFSDVVLPGGVDGRELAARALELRPGIKVIFTTGFAPGGVLHQGRLSPHPEVISKPFRLDELARRIRETLDSG